ncbi:hypothetical protein BIV25_28840 [Streptomyces sp. MUSC 14]|nr:hypothetical protein BIV25_28840 [Streptomyces sp. MUSC 14]
MVGADMLQSITVQTAALFGPWYRHQHPDELRQYIDACVLETLWLHPLSDSCFRSRAQGATWPSSLNRAGQLLHGPWLRLGRVWAELGTCPVVSAGSTLPPDRSHAARTAAASSASSSSSRVMSWKVFNCRTHCDARNDCS